MSSKTCVPFKRLLIVFSLSFLWNLSFGQSSVEAMANRDEMSVRTWRALGPTLTTSIRKSSTVQLIPKLSERFNLSTPILRKFLIYTLNYTRNDLDTQKVLYRYPHYYKDSLTHDLEAIHAARLIKKIGNTSSYRTTSKGNQLLKAYWKLRVKQVQSYYLVEPESLEVFRDVLKKILVESKKMEGSKSVSIRMRSRPNNFNRLPLVVQVGELLKEYTAFINDVSHYKYDVFFSETTNQSWQDLKLSPLAKELMSATRNQRIYDLDRCYTQPNWRVGKTGCESATKELMELGFIRREGNNIYQTATGTKISDLAEELNDRRRYAAWKTITPREYDQFTRGLEWIEKNLQD